MRNASERGEGMTLEGRAGDTIFEILKNGRIVELIRLAGVATQTFAPGSKHAHATNGYLCGS